MIGELDFALKNMNENRDQLIITLLHVPFIWELSSFYPNFADEKTKRRIFNIHTGKMTLADDVNIEDYIMSKDDLSGADIKAICTEAGLMALR